MARQRTKRYEDELSSFVIAVAEFGYAVCPTGDLQEDAEKIALYGFVDNVDHAARQLPDGRWTSKLGIYGDDIEHDTADAVSGGVYGRVVAYFSRPRLSTL